MHNFFTVFSHLQCGKTMPTFGASIKTLNALCNEIITAETSDILHGGRPSLTPQREKGHDAKMCLNMTHLRMTYLQAARTARRKFLMQ